MPREDPLIIFAGFYSEPLLHPEMEDVIAQLGEQHYRFGLYTNGLKLEERIMERMIERAGQIDLKSKKPSYVSFDISASLLTNNFVDELLPRITKLVEKKKEAGSPLQINAPILAISGKCDYDFMHLVVEKLDSVGVDIVRFGFPWVQHTGEEVSMYGFLPREDYKRSVIVFKRLEQRFTKVVIRRPEMRNFDHCFVMAESLSISPEGDVYPCPEVCAPIFKEQYSFGFVLKDRIDRIWHSSKHRDVFLNFDPNEGRCVCCPVDKAFNELCGIYWKPRI